MQTFGNGSRRSVIRPRGIQTTRGLFFIDKLKKFHSKSILRQRNGIKIKNKAIKKALIKKGKAMPNLSAKGRIIKMPKPPPRMVNPLVTPFNSPTLAKGISRVLSPSKIGAAKETKTPSKKEAKTKSQISLRKKSQIKTKIVRKLLKT